MSGRSEDRARVPFALVGVVLLLGSVGYANTVALAGPVGGVDSAGETLERTEASARPAVRAAVASAARETAMAPVTAPADTPAGSAIDGSSPFRDALRLRIHGAVARSLSVTEVDDGVTVGTASLPPVDSAADFDEAKRRIRVRAVDDGTAMTVTVRNVTLTARRGGRTVATERTDYVVTVAVPVLAMHDRTRRYERRLNAGPLEGPGLGRQLTWRLTAVAEARGLAQYGGAPVRNVLANRHVELSTNAATLREQRAAFGRADPDGRVGVARATARVGTTDLLGPATSHGPAWTDTVLSAAAEGGAGAPEEARASDGTPSPPARATDSTVTVGVNHTADVAFAALVGSGLDELTRRAYRARVSRHVRVTSSVEGSRPPPEPPGKNWTLVGERTTESTAVVDRATRATPAAREFLDTTVTVRTSHEGVRTWVRGTTPNRTVVGEPTVKQTRVTWADEHEVQISVTAAYLSPPHAPSRPVSPAFTRGGALDGPNLADVRPVALDRLAGRTRTDALARGAVDDGGDTRTIVVTGERPDELETWVYRDVASLRERVRDVSVRVPRDDVAAGEANTPAALAAALRDRRMALVGAPATYDGAGDAARVSARAAYLELVVARLEARGRSTDRRNREFRGALEDASVPLTDRLDEVSGLAAPNRVPDPRPVGRGPAGEVVLTPDADPGYLTLTAVSRERLPAGGTGEAVHPLAARNTNVFTVPADDVGGAVAGIVPPERQKVPLATAGRALVRANRTLAVQENRSLRRHRDDLAAAVADSTAAVRDRADSVLEVRAGDRLSESERLAALDAADARFPGLGERATAASNGTYADVVAREAAARGGLTPMERDRLGVYLRVELASKAGGEAVGVPADLANETVRVERSVARTVVHDVAASGTERAADRLRKQYAGGRFGPVVAGLPVAPVPGYWYATVNVWSVEVRGHYPSFTVEARVGQSGGAGSVLRYVRDGGVVRFDADGDGDAERVGRTERVAFRTRTVVLVVVPAGRSGVGDVDGDADERSAGWPCPDVSVPTCGEPS